MRTHVSEFLAKLVIAAIIAVVAYAVGQVADLEWLRWWVAGLIGVAVSFGGWFIIVNGEEL